MLLLSSSLLLLSLELLSLLSWSLSHQQGGTPVLLKCSQDGRTVSVEALNKHHDLDQALNKHPGNEHHDVSPEPSKEAGSLERAALRAASNENGCSHELGTPELSSVSVCEVSPERRKSPPLTSAVKRTGSPPTRTPSPPRPWRAGEGETHSCSVESLGSGPRPLASPGSRDSVRFQLH